ncbi:uncharacterized protein RHOBADRAFT_54012 [Rhodotorula graminis WP1]|uniref:Class E vacuolar protein-sorting machinery protein HSE1 n=1 Tax=Rhodotorula graminis (strain WP1) TaxID=578459 RepID=A0A194S0U3_RHOGW|nr:uncharacterized protein RHOBADRAFT_54012 [Rhodotorula graminis WP1]KPV74154.1 hypothetical protein RHOBADRAFT_54012 [Rhodotorula graminis WP1]
MFGRPANPYDEVVAKATDEKQTEINWEVALNVCDKVNDDGETGARNCVAAIQKRFTHRSANVQLFSLTLAGALVNNCSGSLHREISGKAFTQALVRLVNDRTTHDTVKKEALKQIETWVKEHPNNTDFDLLVETYESLKRQGHNFHPERPPTPKGPSDDLLRREEEELQRALAESAALADPRRNYQPSSSSARARSPSPAPSTARPSASNWGPSFVRGLYDFEGESSDELPFRRGDTIRVLEKVSEEWWRGELRGRTGIFPTNYIEELPEDFSPAGGASHGAASAATAPNPDAAEAEILAQAAAVDKLLALMHQLRARGEDFADNEELTDLYNSSMALRPKVVQLIRKYEQKQADLQAMHEKVDRARATYEQMAGMHASHGYAQQNGFASSYQQQQPHPSADPYGHPGATHSASPYHQPPSSYHPQQPPHAVPPLAQQHQPPPQHQQQPQYQQAPPPVSAEDEAQREYERQMAEYQQKLAEYNAQVAALQAAGSPAPAAAGPAHSGEHQRPDAQQHAHRQAEPQQSQQAQQAPQPVWDAQTGAWVWPAQAAAPPPPHEGAPAPALSPAPAQGYPSQTQPYGPDRAASPPPPAHGQQQQQQGYPLAEHMAQLSVGAGSPPPVGAGHAHAYVRAPYGASATSPPPVQHTQPQPHPGSPHQHGAPPGAAQPVAGPYYAQQGAPPAPQHQQADEQQAAWAAWHSQQQQGPGAAGPGSAGGR